MEIDGFKDLWNPTKEEIEKWAYKENMLIEQDWELAVYDFDNADLMIKLASDEECPKQRFFLSCLYVMVGDAIRRNEGEDLKRLKEMISGASGTGIQKIEDWVKRSLDLLASPDTFDNKFWGFCSAYVYD